MNQLSLSDWGFEPAVVVCANCDWSYLLPVNALPPDGSPGMRCPNCTVGVLNSMQQPGDQLEASIPYLSPPELLLPHSVPAERLAQQVRTFAHGIPFASPDLNPETLAKRLKRIYLPQWLVDVGVRGNWQFEAGFDYQVVSHQERYSDAAGGWQTREVKETRVRWEPRTGTLDRSFYNLAAPALETHARLRGQVGDFDISAAQSYSAQDASDSFIRLPDRSQQDAWPDVVPVLQAAAANECQAASSADHYRDFRWQPDYYSRSWTLLLRPVYTTYYLDDQDRPQPVLINGQSGQMSGMRVASMRRARRTTLLILAVAVLIFVVGVVFALLGLAAPPLIPVGGLAILMAVLVGMGALVPLLLAWNFNKNEGKLV